MADSEVLKRCLNPVILNLRKMELELKCPTCLKLLEMPVMLPCTHIFCSHCIAVLPKNGCECPSCKLSFLHQDLRPAGYIKSLLNIYKDMNSALTANFPDQKPNKEISDKNMPTRESPLPGNDSAREMPQRDSALTANFPDQKPNKEISDKNMPTRESPLPGNDSAREMPQRESVDRMARAKKADLELRTSNTMTPKEGTSDESATQRSKVHMQNLGDDAPVDQGDRYSPPSFGSNKDSDCDNSDAGNAHQIKRSLRMVKEKEVCDGHTPQLGIGSTKRQKLNSESDVGDKGGISTEDFTTPNPGCEHNPKSCTSTHPLENVLDASRYSIATRIVECVFCHSFRTTVASGRMIHFLNGKEVDVDQAAQPNVFHVHEKCVQWSPQIYYSGETIKNLEAELLRASKLKCSSCGLKGAALGCYAKSCRKSYHVPCAYEIIECRWDCENFLMLCPAHSSHKLPCERSNTRSKNKAKNSIGASSPPDLISTVTEEHVTLTTCPQWGGDLILCGSSLSKEEKGVLDKFACTSKAVVANLWEPKITHVIASVDDRGGCSRTLKYLMAILTGKWVLTIEWIKACMKAGHLVPEEPYEVAHDVHGCFDGPKTGRTRYMQKAPKLLSGLSFYVANDFHQASFKKYLEDLVLAGGGTLLKKTDLMHDQQAICGENSPKVFIIYSAEPPLAGYSRDFDEVLKQRSVEAEALAADLSGRAISHTLFLDNIAACDFPLN